MLVIVIGLIDVVTVVYYCISLFYYYYFISNEKLFIEKQRQPKYTVNVVWVPKLKWSNKTEIEKHELVPYFICLLIY